MKEKIKRILDLIRAGKLTLDDAAPLLAALNTKLALQTSDRELLDSLLKRDDLDSAQVAEHLMLLRGLKDMPPTPPQAPQPPRPPRPPFDTSWAERMAERAEHQAARAEHHAQRAQRRAGGIEGMVERIVNQVERAVETAVEGAERTMTGKTADQYGYETSSKNRILKIEANSENGDNYEANLPVSLAPHLHKLIPEHGRRTLEKTGFSIEALQLIIEADPPSGKIIEAQDENGNRVEISIK